MMAKRLSVFFCLATACGPGSPPLTSQTFSAESSTTGGSAGGDTGDNDASPLTISAVESSVTENTVVVSWDTNAPADSTVAYGVSNFGTTQDSPELVLQHQVALENVAAGTYEFRVVSKDAENHLVTDAGSGNGYHFTVGDPNSNPLPAAGPKISAVASSVAGDVITVTWTTDVAADAKVDLGTTTTYATATQSNATPTTSHSVAVTAPGAGSYLFRVTSTDANGTTTDDNSGEGYAVTIALTPNGTISAPFIIDTTSLPVHYTDGRDTAAGGVENLINVYPPAAQNEDGPEFVYEFTLTAPADFSATHSGDETGDVDIDVMLCSSLDSATGEGALYNDSTSSRDNTGVSISSLPAGTYYLVLDTFDSTTYGLEPGQYALTVTITAP